MLDKCPIEVFLQKAILCSTWWAGGCLFCETDRAAPQVSQVRRGPKVRGMSLECAAVPAPGGASPSSPRICCRNETASAARQDMEKLEGSPVANFVLLDSPAAPFRERRRLGSETNTPDSFQFTISALWARSSGRAALGLFYLRSMRIGIPEGISIGRIFVSLVSRLL